MAGFASRRWTKCVTNQIRSAAYGEGIGLSLYYWGCVANAVRDPQAKHYFHTTLGIAVEMQAAKLILFFYPGLATNDMSANEIIYAP